MRYINILIILTILLGIISCEKNDNLTYDNDAGVYFSLEEELQETNYSFFLNPGKDKDTVLLPLLITGRVIDEKRTVKAVVVSGENTTASEDQYEILDGYVDTNKVNGFIPVVVYKSAELADKIVSVEVKLVSSGDFPLMDMNKGNFKLNFTAQLIKPNNWDYYCYLFFGIYSARWFDFIVETTGDPAIGSTMDEEFLTYVNLYEFSPSEALGFFPDATLSAYQNLVRLALRDYNNAHPADPLKHDDGTVVVMP